jgi:hypothetical protein
MGIVEKEFVGFDWTLTEMIWLFIKTNHTNRRWISNH